MPRKSSVESPKNARSEFVAIPRLVRSLHQKIIRIQARENVDFDEACSIAASVLEENIETFNKAVDSKANSLYKQRFMTETNKVSQSIRKQSLNQGREDALKYYPLLKRAGWEIGYSECLLLRKYTCSKCHKPGILLDSQLQEIEKSLSHKDCNIAVHHETLIRIIQDKMPTEKAYTNYRKMFEDFLGLESKATVPMTESPVIVT